MRPVLKILRLLAVSALAGAAWVAHRPETVPALAEAPNHKAEDVLNLLHQAAITRAAVQVITEEELNRHLAASLTARMRASIGNWATFDGVRVDLEPELARVYMIWKIKGYTRTVRVDLNLARDANNYHVELLGGAYGHLEVPRGMLRPLFPVLKAVADAMDPEIRALFQMTNITLAKDKLVLDPRFPSA